MRVTLKVIGLAVFVAAASQPALSQGLIVMKRLSAALAHEAVAEAVAVCAKAGYAVTAVIVDNEGVRQAVLRGDGAHDGWPPAVFVATLGHLEQSKQLALRALNALPVRGPKRDALHLHASCTPAYLSRSGARTHSPI